MPRKIGIGLAIILLLFALHSKPFWQNISYSRPELSRQIDKLPANTIFIDKLGIEAPIIYTEQNSHEAFQKALANGAVHYPDTALFGEYGNAYLFGHSSDFVWSKGDYKTVFALLPRIEIGDEIVVSDKDGNAFIYKVIETKVVKPDDLSVLAQDHTRKLLTLQTSYPLGTALRRFIIIAELKV